MRGREDGREREEVRRKGWRKKGGREGEAKKSVVG